MQRISHWKIADLADVDPDARYNVDFRFRLDVSQLPRPFQIGAVGHADWNIAAMRNQRAGHRERAVSTPAPPASPGSRCAALARFPMGGGCSASP